MNVDYLVMGHTHSIKSNDKDGIRSYVVGSLCGSDDFANGLDGQYEFVVE